MAELSVSSQQTSEHYQAVTHLSGRQAASMHYRAATPPRGSWTYAICLAVAERATFVESGNVNNGSADVVLTVPFP